MERLASEAQAILALESETVAGHNCKVLVMRRGANAGRWVQVLPVRVAAPLDAAPRLRQRLAMTPLGLAPPVWIDDAEFDITNHVRPLPADVGAGMACDDARAAGGSASARGNRDAVAS
jgi:hypothetical protein